MLAKCEYVSRVNVDYKIASIVYSESNKVASPIIHPNQVRFTKAKICLKISKQLVCRYIYIYKKR